MASKPPHRLLRRARRRSLQRLAVSAVLFVCGTAWNGAAGDDRTWPWRILEESRLEWPAGLVVEPDVWVWAVDFERSPAAGPRTVSLEPSREGPQAAFPIVPSRPAWPGPSSSPVAEGVLADAAGGPAAAGILPLPAVEGFPDEEKGLRSLPAIRPPGSPSGVPWAESRWPWLSRAGHLLLEDQRGFYSCESVTGIAAAFGAGALMANTGFDTTVQNAWQRSVTPSDLGTFFSGCKDIGEGRYALAVFGTAAATGVALDGLPVADVVGDWGERSLRIFVVGAAPLYVLQIATGASRPEESSAGSQWKFFQDSNGVSGHAFVGAIPFLAAAGMVESPLAKGSLYVCSTFVGFSRVTDDAHYPSQVFLGWYLAFASAMAVNRTDLHFAGMEVEVVPIVMGDAQGLGLVAAW
jgi:membrane-associated phospholipid phosphatase